MFSKELRRRSSLSRRFRGQVLVHDRHRFLQFFQRIFRLVRVLGHLVGVRESLHEVGLLVALRLDEPLAPAEFLGQFPVHSLHVPHDEGEVLLVAVLHASLQSAVAHVPGGLDNLLDGIPVGVLRGLEPAQVLLGVVEGAVENSPDLLVDLVLVHAFQVAEGQLLTVAELLLVVVPAPQFFEGFILGRVFGLFLLPVGVPPLRHQPGGGAPEPVGSRHVPVVVRDGAA